MSKYYEDSYASCCFRGFRLEDNPSIHMIRITAVNANCSNMYDLDYEYNYFLDYSDRDLLINYLTFTGFYHGDLYEAIKDKYGEYLDKCVIFCDFQDNCIPYIEDSYYHGGESKYKDFTKIRHITEFRSMLPHGSRLR